MKRLLGDTREVVEDLVDAMIRADTRLNRVSDQTVLLRSDTRQLVEAGKVALISGGGSGHEPAHAGYIGAGMLTAAVLGPVFTSPSVDAVLAAIRSVGGSAGVLLIVKNYTGDRLNFGLAADIARAEGYRVEIVLVGDDVAIAQPGRAGRRGLVGTVLVHKVAGAAAERGATLDEVKNVALSVAARVSTMSVALGGCTLPGADQPNFQLGADEMEFGLGIHGEPGVQTQPMAPLDTIVEGLLESLYVNKRFGLDDQLVLLVNNLGTTTIMELTQVAGAALRKLESAGYRVARVAVGTLLTAIDMPGCSITLLPITEDQLVLLDVSTAAPAWPGMTKPGKQQPISASSIARESSRVAGPSFDDDSRKVFERCINQVTRTLEDAETELTTLDSMVGDGDLGTSLARGAQAVREALPDLSLERPAEAFAAMSQIVRRVIGGTSGPLTSALLLGVAHHLRGLSVAPTSEDWAAAFANGCEAIMRIGGAGRGDRTMLDALLPASEALSRGLGIAVAADAAEEGAQGTRRVTAQVGRSSYLGDRVLGHPDPGAVACALWLRALANELAS